MTITRHIRPPAARGWLIAAGLATCLSAGCSLVPKRQPAIPTAIYVLELPAAARATTPEGGLCGTLLVQPPQPAPGFLTSRMIYTRSPHRLEQFAWSRWADTPSAMLEPLVLEILKASGGFEIVVAPPAPVNHDLVLAMDHLRMLQVFTATSSEVVLSVDVRLFNPSTRTLLGNERLTVSEPAAESSPEAGVEAASRAVGRLLDRLAQFAAAGARTLCPS